MGYIVIELYQLTIDIGDGMKLSGASGTETTSTTIITITQHSTEQQGGHSREPSASSSFLRFIRSLRLSASRRACWMRVCMASGETSVDMATVVGADGGRGRGERATPAFRRCAAGREFAVGDPLGPEGTRSG